MRPLAIDLFVGLGGWSAGLVAAGWRSVGFDLENMFEVLNEPMPEHFSLVIQDVRTLHGSQFKDAQLLVGSSPCTKYSYMAMPWQRAKALAAWYEEEPSRQVQLNELFDAQFRIQREASEAAGRQIPMVGETGRGVQRWVGRARANFGSYYLYGDVPALMPIVQRTMKNVDGGSWFGLNPDGSPGALNNARDGRKTNGDIPHIRTGARSTPHLTNAAEHRDVRAFDDAFAPSDGRKGAGYAWFKKGTGAWARDPVSAAGSHGSPRRKAASAKIAKIPFTLAHWIGKTWFPMTEAA